MRAGVEFIICCPTSVNDGKRVRFLSAPGYDVENDTYDEDFYDVELIGTGQVGGIHKRFLSEIQ